MCRKKCGKQTNSYTGLNAFDRRLTVIQWVHNFMVTDMFKANQASKALYSCENNKQQSFRPKFVERRLEPPRYTRISARCYSCTYLIIVESEISFIAMLKKTPHCESFLKGLAPQICYFRRSAFVTSLF